MATLVFDIETAALPWETLPALTRNAATSWIEKGKFLPEEQQRKLAEVKDRATFSPFLAEIISLAVYDVERQVGSVYFVAPETGASFELDGITYKVRTEKELLEDWWEGARSYDTFVSFNGRSFALPFLQHRSAIQQVRPSVTIARARYLTRQTLPYHVDLLDEFSFYGAMERRPSLAMLCGAYGVSHPSLLGGEEVAMARQDGRYRLIAEKNAADVLAITALYEHWKQYFAPDTWLNTLENL